MFYACAARFDVIENLNFFFLILRWTKQGLSWEIHYVISMTTISSKMKWNLDETPLSIRYIMDLAYIIFNKSIKLYGT